MSNLGDLAMIGLFCCASALAAWEFIKLVVQLWVGE